MFVLINFSREVFIIQLISGRILEAVIVNPVLLFDFAVKRLFYRLQGCLSIHLNFSPGNGNFYLLVI